MPPERKMHDIDREASSNQAGHTSATVNRRDPLDYRRAVVVTEQCCSRPVLVSVMLTTSVVQGRTFAKTPGIRTKINLRGNGLNLGVFIASESHRIPGVAIGVLMQDAVATVPRIFWP